MKSLMYLSLASLVVLAGCHHEQKPVSSSTTPANQSVPVAIDNSTGDGATPLSISADTADASGKIDLENYQPYSAARFAELKGEQKFVVFFHADWCPTCIKWEERLKSNIGQLPSTALILKADYDEEQPLARELGVTKQSTAVMFDTNGDIINRASDPSIDDLIAFFDNAPQDESDAAAADIVEIIQDDAVESESEVAIATAEPAVYKAYSASAEADLKGKQAYAVYFKADWCPTCHKFDAKLEQEIGSFPEGTVILKADYDAETALKKQLGVTQQTTVVVLNDDGKVQYKKVNPSLDEFKAQF